jgi:glycosyltransferase involved in cell wall biosynthesis
MGHPLSAEQQRASRTLDNLKVFESNFRLEWMEDAWTDVGDAIPWLLKTRDRVHPDLIHLNGFVHGAIPWNAPTLIAGHCALILGDISSLRENWHDAALFVTPEDRAQLKSMIQRLTRDPHELRRWAARAQERAQAFTPERMAANYMELYRTL